ncbi:MAG: hypothetical protein HRU09_04670 [Oligoflexales bacterium]|nr:hypothetical protein [Oligoflexales bacterium]
MEELMLGSLSVRIDVKDNAAHYTFSGEVDEGFSHRLMPDLAQADTFLDLAQVNAFNSCGIREWVFWIKKLSINTRIHFIACSIAMIDQINMIPESLGSGTIESFYAPYFCVKCGEVNKLIELSEHQVKIANKKAPFFACESCSTALTFDTLDSSYFLFVEHQKGFPNAS